MFGVNDEGVLKHIKEENEDISVFDLSKYPIQQL